MNNSVSHRAFKFGPMLVSVTRQPEGAPVFDKSHSSDMAGNHYRSVAVHLTPWRHTKHGDRSAGMCLVLGWKC